VAEIGLHIHQSCQLQVKKTQLNIFAAKPSMWEGEGMFRNENWKEYFSYLAVKYQGLAKK
jgi:hypothetical protein